MNTNKVKYKIISSYEEWMKLISNDEFIVHNVDIFNNSLIQVFYSSKEEMFEGSNQCNIPIASFVTAQARLKLLNELNKLDKRVLYYDTDSIIYISRENEYEPALGDYLGQFTNELEDKEHIIEFVSAGPKNYAYKTNTGKCQCVVKGFTLNYISSQKINFDSIKNIVLNDQSEKIHVDQLKFTRNKHNWEINTSVILKKYGFVYDKRILLLDNYETIPYGY
jgi:hypothetical protein